jgi:structure-specific recognition protein 1
MQSHNPHTFVVITLDPPIRKGQTLYPHIVIQVFYYHSIFTLNWIKCSFNRKLISSLYEQFETETVVERELTLSEEVLAEKYKDRLESSYRVI